MTVDEGAAVQDLSDRLFRTVEDRPLVSVHNGLPARFLAEDLPATDPLTLLIAHDQGFRGLLRAHGSPADFDPGEDWHEAASRKAFTLLWNHLVRVRAEPWMAADGDALAAESGLPPFIPGRTAEDVYDEVAERLVEEPIHPRRALAAANVGMLFTSDDPADDLAAHDVLSADPAWAGRVAPAFSPDRYLQVQGRLWRTDTELLAEVTGVDTGDLPGFLAALRKRREVFLDHGALVAEYHSSDVGARRVSRREAAGLYRLGQTAELLPDESLALQRHLLWEMAAMSADDGLVMAVYPPAGFDAGVGVAADRGLAARLRPLVTDFGAEPAFCLWLFSIDVDAYLAEVVPLAAECATMTAVPPTRFADDPARLRDVRVAAVRELGASRVLGLVDDMSGPFVLTGRHRLARRLDAAALAELVAAREISEPQAFSDLATVTGRSTAGSAAAQAV